MTGPIIALAFAAALVAGLYAFTRPSPPSDPAVWHKWSTLLPVRLMDGRRSRSVGQLWRRQTASGWEYRQDNETEDDFASRSMS